MAATRHAAIALVVVFACLAIVARGQYDDAMQQPMYDPVPQRGGGGFDLELDQDPDEDEDYSFRSQKKGIFGSIGNAVKGAFQHAAPPGAASPQVVTKPVYVPNPVYIPPPPPAPTAAPTTAPDDGNGKSKCAKPGNDCIEPVLRIDPVSGDDPIMSQLLTQLKDVKEQIRGHKRGILNEETWAEQVQEIIKIYTAKIEKVQEHIGAEHKLVDSLNKKKHQVRSEIKRRRLEGELKAATEDLKTLQQELDQVKGREDEFQSSKSKLEDKINNIQGDIKNLAGTPINGTASASSTGSAAPAAAAGAAGALAGPPSHRSFLSLRNALDDESMDDF